jgi:hypothetical protein
MKKNNNNLDYHNIDYFNIELQNNEIRVFLTIVIILVIILLFRKKFSNFIERIIVFTIIFLLFLVITKNLIITFIGTCLIFLLVNLIIKYRDTIEKFEDLKVEPIANDGKLLDTDIFKESSGGIQKILSDITGGLDKRVDPSTITTEPEFDKNIFENDVFKKSSEGIQELLKQVNGGIELKDDDLTETDILNIDVGKYNNDKKPNALKDAQKETYELINTVNALKDTISTLAPVLKEGKKLMSIFENLKI